MIKRFNHIRALMLCASWLLLGLPAMAMAQLTANEAIDIVQQRYQGELLDIEVKSGRGWENSDQVYELRLLTEQGNVLKIRIARENGRFLEIDGRGQIEARLLPASASEGT
ncbi:Cys/Met metabolism pyridoxal-phosphate-dependent enzyme [Vreelandella venusta]|nr:Cys/Met metabolism pyridoxal-phosphate-dependent enzyme [Halomonas hydrothermalis]